MKRIAKCHCGELTVEVAGEPEHIFMCHCELCQCRTGTSYNLSAWFPERSVSVRGETKEYVRKGDSGAEATFHFCPTCGSNVYWENQELLPELIGIAVGCFVDPEFPKPTMSLYGKRRHHWLTMPAGVPSFVGDWSSEQEST